MKKSIIDLKSDIYQILDQTNDHEPSAERAASYAMRIGGELAKATLKRDKPREKGKLWASDLGKPCMRQHWYRFNLPEAGEPLLGHTKFKFLYGNILEEAVLYMAEEAGHEVTDQQGEVETRLERPTKVDWSIRGRIDGLVDKVLVDVKSTSSFGFERYRYGITDSNDSFGYLWQLGFYKEFGTFNETPVEEGFIFIDKQNGHIEYVSAVTPTKEQLLQRAADIADAVEEPNGELVPRFYAPEAYGKSGNEALTTTCSYCSYKRECWKESNNGDGLRTFAYNHKPVSFTKIVREPKVPEILEKKDAT